MMREGLRVLLEEKLGYECVAEVDDGDTAVSKAKELKPDVVIMDIVLPHLNGIEATRRLTADPGGPVVLLLSTYDEDEVDAAGSGAAGYVPKAAFGPDRLSAAWQDAGRTADQG